MIEGADPRATIAAAMEAFRPLPRAERYGRVSLWTMYYFGALIVPAIAAGVRTGYVPTTAIDALACSLDRQGRVTRFWPKREAESARRGEGFDDLVENHLEVMISICDAGTGFPARVAWSNAAVMIDYAVAEARRAQDTGDACDTLLDAAEALIAGSRHPRLAHPYRSGARRARRVCCLRYLIPNGTLCPGICPRSASPRLPLGNLHATSALNSR